MTEDLQAMHRDGSQPVASDSTKPKYGEWHYVYRDLIAVEYWGNFTAYVELFHRDGEPDRIHWSILGPDQESEGYWPSVAEAMRHLEWVLGMPKQ